MSKVKIQLVILGRIPFSIDLKLIENWKSDLFEVLPNVAFFNIVGDSNGPDWEYLDDNIQNQLPACNEGNILIAITNVPIEANYIGRRLTGNRICITYDTMVDILRMSNIPLENMALGALYYYSLVFKLYGRIPLMEEDTFLSHDDTRGCLFDMVANKADIIYSMNKPALCQPCLVILTSSKGNRIEKNLIESVQKELKRIKKSLYYRITDIVKTNPLLAIAASFIVAISLGLISSLFASVLWETHIKHWFVTHP
jgi:hypothetical protein